MKRIDCTRPGGARTWLVALTTAVLVSIAWYVGTRTSSSEVPPQPAVSSTAGAPSAPQSDPSLPLHATRDVAPESRGTSSTARDSAVRRSESSQLFVVDAFDNPIAGAQALMICGSGSSVNALTDAEGFATIERDVSAPLTITVEAPGYSAEQLSFPAVIPEHIRVVLRSPSSIAGRVVLRSGESAGAELHVVACAASSADNSVARSIACAAAALEDRSTLHAVTDADGRFEIVGPVKGRHYEVFAGGRGLAMSEARGGISAGEDELMLRVAPAFGLSFHFEENGEVVQPRLITLNIAAAPSEGRLDSTVHRGSAVLAGLPPQQAQVTTNSRVWLYLADARRDTVGPIWLDATLVGYAPVRHALDARPLDQALVDEPVGLRRTAAGFGDVHVQLVGARVAREDATGGFLGAVLLEDAAGTSRPFALRWTAPDRGAAEGVPFGRYSARFTSLPEGSFVSPRAPAPAFDIEVGEEPVELSIDATDTGILEVLVQRQASIVMLALARGELRETPFGPRPNTQSFGRALRFESTRCVFPLAAPGHVLVQDQQDGALGGGEVRRGERTQLVVEKVHRER